MPSATRRVGARVELDGEKEYKQAISELNTGSKTLASEMRKLQAEYKGNTESTEYLTKAGDILNRELLQQQDKVAKLREIVQQMAAKYGEADSRTQSYVQQLNSAEAQEFNLQHAIEDNTKALEGQGEELTGLGDTVSTLADKLGIRLPQGATDALNGMKSFSAGSVAAMAAVTAGVAAAIKVLKELQELTIEVAAQADTYLTESAITGVPTEMLQAWDYAAPLIDVDAETIKGAMTKITQAMGNASEGNEAAQASFSALGVSITDEVTGQLRSAEDVFYDVVDALGNMENQTQRDAAAMDLMGKSAQDLNPLINAGSKALKEYGKEAENVGYILDQDQIKKLGEVDDAYQKMQLTIEANRKQLAADFAPAAKAAMELFSDGVQKAGEFLERSGLIENLASIIESLLSIIRAAGEILTGLPGFNTALDAVKVTLGAVAQFTAVIADAADAVSSILRLDFSGVKNAFGFGYGSGNANNYQRTVMQQQGRLQQYDDFYGHNAGGTDSWRGGLTWVGEAGPEIAYLPQGSQIKTAQESREFGNVYIESIVIDPKNVKEFNDVIDIMKNSVMLMQKR